MIDALHLAFAVGGLTLSAARAWQLRARDPLLTSLWVTLLFLSLGEAMQVPQVFAFVSELVGRPGAGTVVTSGCVVIASTACRRFAHAILRGDPGSWRRASAPGIAVWLAGALLFWTDKPTPLPPELRGRGFWYDQSINSALMWWLYLAYLGWALVVSFQALRKYARLSPIGPLRTGLTMGAAGIAVGFLFVEIHAVMAGLWLTGRGPALVELDAQLNAAILTISLALIGLGTIFPPLTATITAARVTMQERRALRQLKPLADYLRAVAPYNAFDLEPSDRTQRLVATGTSIRDRQRHLRHYVTPTLQRQALSRARALASTPEDAHALSEAAWLEVAARAKRQGELPVAARYDPPFGGDTLTEEIAALTRLARAHRRDSTVHSLIRELEAAAPESIDPLTDSTHGTEKTNA